MIGTVVLVQSGLAVEANPLLAWTFNIHATVFVLVKWVSFAVPALLADAILPQCSAWAQRWCWWIALAAYACLYVGGMAVLHL